MTQNLLRLYGITADQRDAMISKQEGLCKICGKPEESKPYLSVDHCHITGIIRGMLCDNCNNGLGRFKDSPELLRKAAEYLESIKP